MLASGSYDALIVGGGPAGLTAAIYLGRYRRSALVVDRGGGRASWIPLSRNAPGYPDGIEGRELLENMKRQALKYNATLVDDEIVQLQRMTIADQAHAGLAPATLAEAHTSPRGNLDDSNLECAFVATTRSGRVYRARTVVLATGVADIQPDIPNFDIRDAISRHLVRHCAVCDAFEVADQKVAILDSGDEKGINEGRFLRTYTSDITLLTNGGDVFDLEACQRFGIKCIIRRITGIEALDQPCASEEDDGGASKQQLNASQGDGDGQPQQPSSAANSGGSHADISRSGDSETAGAAQQADSNTARGTATGTFQGRKGAHGGPQSVRITFADGHCESFDTVYTALGARPCTLLAVQVGACIAEGSGSIECLDNRMMTVRSDHLMNILQSQYAPGPLQHIRLHALSPPLTVRSSFDACSPCRACTPAVTW